jgi:hypothetical protein
MYNSAIKRFANILGFHILDEYVGVSTSNVLIGLFVFNLARPPAHFDRLFERHLVNLRGTVGKTPAILRFVIHFGIRALAQINILHLFDKGRNPRRETGEE